MPEDAAHEHTLPDVTDLQYLNSKCFQIQIIYYSIKLYYLWKATGQEDVNLEIRKRKCGRIGHTLRKDGEIPKAALQWNPQRSRKRGGLINSWRRSVIKEAGRSWYELRFLAALRSGKNS
jgi:hypothetical protein